MGSDDVWIIDGTLEPIEFDGFADDRAPLALAERIVAGFSKPDDWILDPFAGLGSTLFAAEKLGRKAVGFEPNPHRADYVSSRITSPSRIIADRIQALEEYNLPTFNLVVTSPPYITVDLEDDPWGPTYFEDMKAIFAAIARHMRQGGKLVVEVSNVRTEDGFRPLASQFGSALRNVLHQSGEIIRVNSSDWPAGPGVSHSSLLVFEP